MMLDGRSAIITGASQGLGRAIASHFVRNGADVLLVARSESGLRQVETEIGRQLVRPDQRVLRVCGDVAVAQTAHNASAMAAESLRGPYILVNNAGILGPVGRTEDVDWEEWAHTIQVNLFGVVHLCRAFLPLMRKEGYGKIINLSGGGATSPMPRVSAYAASKAAVVRLTETLAHELRDTRVDVNAVAPGAMNTQFLEAVLTAGPERAGTEYYDRACKQSTEGGVSPDRGALLAVFLASAASDGITGRLISAVWDDWSSLPRRREKLAAGDVYTLRRITPKDRGDSW